MGSRLIPMTAITPLVGAHAPDFALESDGGARTTLGDFQGKWLVLYFYPRDNTPGCTREAQDFTEAATRLGKLGAQVVGVSKDSIKSHGTFRDKIKIGFPLLSDPDRVAHRAYGAWGKKMMYGKTIEGTLRSTFLIAPDGAVARIWKSVKVDGHAEAVVEAIRELRSPESAPKVRPKAKKTATKAKKKARP
jgi:peroxiredoxin Q/BCP